jgi:aryl-alcohol dehydrogenase-like predicted oxidoreductase
VGAVRTREIGGTGLRVSEIGFGCGGNAGLMVRGSAAERQPVIARAVELGINYFDNAPDYGDCVAEENLGSDLKALGIRPLVVSKVEIRQDDLHDIAGHVERSVERSLGRLKLDALDIVQIHNGPCASPPQQDARSYTRLAIEDYLKPGGAIEGLERLRRAGKVRYLGFICRGNDVDAIRQLLETGVFHMINVPYTLLNPSAGRRLPEGLELDQDFGAVIDHARGRGVGTAIYSPLAGGYLTDRSASGSPAHPLARPKDPDSAAHRRDLQRSRALGFLRRESQSLAQAAVRFILMHEGVTTVLGGFSDRRQLEEIAAVSGTGPLAPDLMARVEAAWHNNFEPI